MKKFLAATALISTLAINTALAENTGYFIGADLGFGAIKLDSTKETNWRYGVIAGYKEFIDSEGQTGYRIYANLTTGPRFTGSNNFRAESLSIGLNGEVLHNFMDNGIVEYGAFFGLGVGYTQNTFSNSTMGDTDVNGLDLGLNFGLRANYAANHGLELWSRFGLIDPSQSVNNVNYKIRRPYAFGLRYVFNLQ